MLSDKEVTALTATALAHLGDVFEHLTPDTDSRTVANAVAIAIAQTIKAYDALNHS